MAAVFSLKKKEIFILINIPICAIHAVLRKISWLPHSRLKTAPGKNTLIIVLIFFYNNKLYKYLKLKKIHSRPTKEPTKTFKFAITC